MTKTVDTSRDPNRIRALRTERKMSMAALGERLGTDASTVNKLEKGKMQLTERWIAALVEALAVSPNDLLIHGPHTGADRGYDFAVQRPDGSTQAFEVKRRGGKVEVREAELEPPAPFSMPANVPVMGTAAGSHLRGAFALEMATVVDWVRRPPALLGAERAYALYIEGTSMEPKFQQGDLVFVHPARPPRMGDYVIVQVQTAPELPIEATIGSLKRRTEKFVTIGKLNPLADIDLKRDTVVAIHKVLSLNELFGV